MIYFLNHNGSPYNLNGEDIINVDGTDYSIEKLVQSITDFYKEKASKQQVVIQIDGQIYSININKDSADMETVNVLFNNKTAAVDLKSAKDSGPVIIPKP
jgi:hypothetical protein